MPKPVKSISAAERGKTLDASMRALLGPPPLLPGEDAAAYEALYDRLLGAVEPKDALEEMWVRDVADLCWETLRLRRLKAAFMASSAWEGLDQILRPLTDVWTTSELVNRWRLGDRASVREVNSLLKKVGLSEDAISAQTLVANLRTLETIDRMIMQTEARRNVALREIDRHRDVLAQRLRDACKEIDGAEYVEIEHSKVAAQ